MIVYHNHNRITYHNRENWLPSCRISATGIQVSKHHSIVGCGHCSSNIQLTSIDNNIRIVYIYIYMFVCVDNINYVYIYICMYGLYTYIYIYVISINNQSVTDALHCSRFFLTPSLIRFCGSLGLESPANPVPHSPWNRGCFISHCNTFTRPGRSGRLFSEMATKWKLST